MKWWTRKHAEPEDPAIVDTPMFKAIDSRLARAMRPGKIILRWLAVFTVLALVAAGTAVWGVQLNRDNAAQLRQDAVNGCVINNAQKAQLDQLLDEQGRAQAAITENSIKEFIDVLEGSHPSAQVLAIAKALEDEIKNSNDKSLATFKQRLDIATQPRNCQQAYSNVSGGTKTAPPNSAKELAAGWEVVELQNWGGYCLTAATGNAGAVAIEQPCGSAHALWYQPSTGLLTLEGHSNVSFGDSGGHFELKSTGHSVATDTQKAGPSGYTYDRMWFGVAGTYWHANGNGQEVSLIGNPGTSLAVYWAWLSVGAHGLKVI